MDKRSDCICMASMNCEPSGIDVVLSVCASMTYILLECVRVKTISVLSFDVLAAELTESREKEGINSFLLVTLTSWNLVPLIVFLSALILRSPIFNFGSTSYTPELESVFVADEHFLL
ncbi:hypothetical protein RF11_09020 [Thelohanellus kitauei]|uniref:Uncharacterized protein n=1 Tax=Thelohanellus kitauei TaxID=669202 RepID=A0A0C2MX73_THEKT|nr:hypothetical protein RF11_09020 [Thelohanellus kitauei]